MGQLIENEGKRQIEKKETRAATASRLRDTRKRINSLGNSKLLRTGRSFKNWEERGRKSRVKKQEAHHLELVAIAPSTLLGGL